MSRIAHVDHRVLPPPNDDPRRTELQAVERIDAARRREKGQPAEGGERERAQRAGKATLGGMILAKMRRGK